MLRKKISQIKKRSFRVAKSISDNIFLRNKTKEQYRKLQTYAERIRADKEKIKNLQQDYDDIRNKYEGLLRTQNPYGSLNPGDKEMEAKWKSSPGKRVLFLSIKDYAGSFMNWAKAVHKYSDFASRMATFTVHPYGYETDIVFSAQDEKYWHHILPLIEEADIIHLKDEARLFSSIYGSTKIYPENTPPSKHALVFARFLKYIFDSKEAKGKPKIFTHYGGMARKFKEDKDYIDFVRSFDVRITMTPDLNYDWFNGYFVPHVVDIDKFSYLWEDSNLVTHSPSTAARKGTQEFLEAMNSFPDLELDLIQGVSHQECLGRKCKGALFFDQAGREIEDRVGISDVIGFYGNSALEAMVHGIPTIAHISEQAFEGAKRAGKDWSKCPVLNPQPNDVQSMKNVISSFYKLSAKEKSDISKKTRLWVEVHHSYQSAAKELAKIYSGLL